VTTSTQRAREPHVVRLPGFIKAEPIGLGDVVKRATSVAAIRPCGGCVGRAERLNRWVAFGGRGSR
jgi:hypothetical protein